MRACTLFTERAPGHNKPLYVCEPQVLAVRSFNCSIIKNGRFMRDTGHLKGKMCSLRVDSHNLTFGTRLIAAQSGP